MTTKTNDRRFEPWYTLATPFKMHKDCGPDGFISELAHIIIVNPISNIGIIRKRIDFLDVIDKGTPIDSIGTNYLTDMITSYYLNTLRKSKEFKKIEERKISEEYSLFGINNPDYNFPMPLLLAILSSEGKLIEIRENYSLQDCFEINYPKRIRFTIDKEAVSFMELFAQDYSHWFEKYHSIKRE